MVFLGTDKYPDPGEFDNVLSSHGGSNNAYTANDQTVYYLDVEHDYLDPMMDRFAQVFKGSSSTKGI